MSWCSTIVSACASASVVVGLSSCVNAIYQVEKEGRELLVVGGAGIALLLLGGGVAH